MKIQSPIISRQSPQHGSVVLVLLILLAVMTLLAAANSSALYQLRRELNLLDHRQVVRLSAAPTNATVVAVSPATREAK
jgi:hypothetical protein